ncbi:MAG: DUF2017 family protein [Planctomycetota bacterium]|nr:DUF2017 family protein [Planctomycetota bacterium]
MLSAHRNADGSFYLVGHPGLLKILWTIPETLRSIIHDPISNAAATIRLFPISYTDPAAQAEHTRLLGDDLKHRQLGKVAIFEEIVCSCNPDSGKIQIPEIRFDPFLAVLTDLRLVLAEELGIESDDWENLLDEEELEDPRVHLLNLIGGIQQLLLEATGMVDVDLHPDDLK